MDKAEKVKKFEKELSFIKNDEVKEFTIKAIENIPNYFFDVPASSTLKYHPNYAIKEHGLLYHTQAAVRILVELFRIESLKYDEITKDLMIASLILHDSRKCGKNDSATRYSLAQHPTLAVEAIKNDNNINTMLSKEQFEILFASISSHMGGWNKDYKSGKEILPKPVKKYQHLVHLADYLASRKCLEFNFDAEIERE